MKYSLLFLILMFLFSCVQDKGIKQQLPFINIDSHQNTIATTDTKSKALDSAIIETPIESKIDEERLLENLFRFENEQDFADYYGQENIVRDIGYQSGGAIQFTVSKLFKGTEKEVTIKWRKGDSTSNMLEDIESVSTSSTYWQTYEGIKVGITLKDLEELNDSSFSFYGFEWDFGGLAFFEHGNLAPISTRMGLRLKAPEKNGDSDYLPLMGERRFNSKNEYAQRLNPQVALIRLVAD